MNELLSLLLTRRSVRRYTGGPIPPETLRAVVTAGLLSPSSRNRRPWRLVVVQDRATLEALSHCRQGSAQMLAGAGAAILVFARERLALPEDWALEAILSLGIPAESPPPHTLEEADWGKVTFL